MLILNVWCIILLRTIHSCVQICFHFWTEKAEATATEPEPKTEDAPGERRCNVNNNPYKNIFTTITCFPSSLFSFSAPSEWSATRTPAQLSLSVLPCLYAWVKVCVSVCVCVFGCERHHLVAKMQTPAINHFQSGFLSHHCAFFPSQRCKFCMALVCFQDHLND